MSEEWLQKVKAPANPAGWLFAQVEEMRAAVAALLDDPLDKNYVRGMLPMTAIFLYPSRDIDNNHVFDLAKQRLAAKTRLMREAQGFIHDGNAYLVDGRHGTLAAQMAGETLHPVRLLKTPTQAAINAMIGAQEAVQRLSSLDCFHLVHFTMTTQKVSANRACEITGVQPAAFTRLRWLIDADPILQKLAKEALTAQQCALLGKAPPDQRLNLAQQRTREENPLTTKELIEMLSPKKPKRETPTPVEHVIPLANGASCTISGIADRSQALADAIKALKGAQ